MTDETKVTELVELTDASSVTELMVADKPGGISGMLMDGDEVAAMTEIAASSPTAGIASTERTPLVSGKVDFVDRMVDVVETELSLLAAETVSEVVMEGVVSVIELEVSERLGVMESEEAEVTETVAGGSVGVVLLVRVVGKVEAGSSGVVALAPRTEGPLLGSVTLVGVVAAAVGLTESVHISVSEGGTGLVKLVDSGTEFESVGSVGVVVAVSAGAAGADGALVGVLDSPSCIWANSFSGVLRPDVERGGPGLITGFGSKAGFPADSCADTLERI